MLSKIFGQKDIFSIICAAFALCILHDAAAQSGGSIDTWKARRKISLLQLDHALESAESDDSAVKEQQRWKRIAFLEELSVLECMPEFLFGKPYAGSPENSLCLRYLEPLEELDPHSPVAKCIRNGSESEVCKEAWNAQVVYPLSERPGAQIIENLTVRTEAFNKDRKQLIDLGDNFKKESNKARYVELVRAYAPHFQHTCTKYAVETVRQDELEVSLERFAKSGDPRVSELKQLLDDLTARHTKEQSKSTSQGLFQVPEQSTTYFRLRIIPDECLSLSKSLLELAPFSSTAICAKEGIFSPFCHTARKREQEKIWPTSSGSKTPSSSSDDSMVKF